MSSAFVNNQKIKLLLHAEDGFIPFLTPYLLKTYFASDAPLVKDHFVVGMAIKDTCIIPAFRSNNDKKGNNGEVILSNKQKKRNKRKITEVSNQENNNSNDETKRQRIGNDDNLLETGINRNHKNEASNDMKPIGYEFGDSNLHDNQSSSMNKSGYNTMIVPTFDLVDDVTNFFLSNIKPKEKCNNYGKKKKSNSSNNKSDENCKEDTKNLTPPNITVSHNQVTLCTPHGMQKLNSSKFIDIALNLKSKPIVGLFDQAFTNDTTKRKMKSILRSQSFMTQMIEKNNDINQDDQKQLWAPLICSSITMTQSDEKNLPEKFDDSLQPILVQKDSISGIALVGWHHIQSCEERVQLLQHCSKLLIPTPLQFAVLATDNLKQILEVARNGANMIGCNLPARWARSRKAIALSLTKMVDGSQGKQGEQGNDKLDVDEDGCIDLTDDIYMEDKAPLFEDCTCFSCNNRTYTRSYVHHLFKAKELLADIIIFGHNLHQMLKLCEELSTARAENNLQEYCQFIENQMK